MITHEILFLVVYGLDEHFCNDISAHLHFDICFKTKRDCCKHDFELN